MRPKFRAWDKHSQKMFANDELIIWNGNVYANDSKKLTCNNLKGWSIDDEYLMQSTGLKDKNGQEIFEGDILEVDDCGEVLGNAKLIWDNEQAAFMIDAISVDDIAPFYEFVSDEDYFYRVIGNIYENPELLEDKK